MAFYCIDYINGSDTTGNGTPAAPWKTIGYGQTQVTLAAGDEWRIHAGAAPVLLDTAAFQTAANSYTITTSVDLTGSLAANDYIFVDNQYRAWRIKTITSTTITLWDTIQAYPDYLGNGVTFNIWKVGGVPITINNFNQQLETCFTTASPFAINSNSVTVSGGWDSTFTAKTAFGTTFFYRTGTYQLNGNSSEQVYKMLDTTGILFKDFHMAGGLMRFFIVATSGQNAGNGSFDNFIVSANPEFGLVSARGNSTADVYCTNFTVVQTTSGNGTNFTLLGSWSPASQLTPPVLYLTNLKQVFIGKGNATQYTFLRVSGISALYFNMSLGNMTYESKYNQSLWGGDFARYPAIFQFTTSINAGATNFNYKITVDSINIVGEPVQLFPTGVGFGGIKSFINLTSANLAKLRFIGGMSSSAITIKAPGSPFDTVSGMFLSADQDSQSLVGLNTNGWKWIDTANNKEWYINNQAIYTLNTTDYVTGTNSIQVRPATVGGVGTAYGFYLPTSIAFMKKCAETATITVKAKLLGPSTYSAPINLYSSSNLDLRTGLNGAFGGFNTDIRQRILLTPNQNATTTEWRDLVYTVSPDTTLGTDAVNGYYFLIGEGQDGSNLAETGRYLLIDSVTITIS